MSGILCKRGWLGWYPVFELDGKRVSALPIPNGHVHFWLMFRGQVEELRGVIVGNEPRFLVILRRLMLPIDGIGGVDDLRISGG